MMHHVHPLTRWIHVLSRYKYGYMDPHLYILYYIYHYLCMIQEHRYVYHIYIYIHDIYIYIYHIYIYIICTYIYIYIYMIFLYVINIHSLSNLSPLNPSTQVFHSSFSTCSSGASLDTPHQAMASMGLSLGFMVNRDVRNM